MTQALSLYLASGSPRRKDLLTEWGYSFQSIPNRLEHEVYPQSGTLTAIKTHIKRLSVLKASLSAASVKDGIVLAADTIVVCSRQLLGKPSTLKEAENMLRQLSGKSHRVLTSISLFHTVWKKTWSTVQSSIVTFKPLTSADIQHYCQNYSVLDKAGSYGIQDIGDRFVHHVQGSLFTVIGLPKFPLIHQLALWGIRPQQKGY
jgi:septum formation protein